MANLSMSSVYEERVNWWNRVRELQKRGAATHAGAPRQEKQRPPGEELTVELPLSKT